MKNKVELKSWFEDDKLYVGEYVKHKINQLDEPEILTPEWIDERIHYSTDQDAFGSIVKIESVPVKYLQNLLVPKQGISEEQAKDVLREKGYTIARMYDDDNKTVLPFDFYRQVLIGHGYIIIEKPTVPQFVAEWIEEVKPDNSLRVAFEYIAQRKRDNHDDELAFWVEEGNSETFAKAWLDGYTVEEEQKYRVLDGNTTLLGRINGLMLTTVEILEYYPEYAPTFELTEQEIKDYDPRYLAFKVPVEEME